jgi:hybrid polyketide synthase / nonribosomal peptide synthetase ACE1
MDPQQRLLLETVYQAMESAGLTIQDMQGSDTAAFVGLMCMDYTTAHSTDLTHAPTYLAIGLASSNASARLSYFFDWHGPCMTIDTACSSSLVAVHEAVETLRTGRSRIAVAAGTNLIFSPQLYISESNLGMLSPTGRSRMWDAKADGYARGEGVACLILKKLSDALADGDHIECIIRETGVNQDGKTASITTPSSISQAELIRATYARAGLNLSDKNDRPQYFEAHGTGTPVGDPQEAEAIFSAFVDGCNDVSDYALYVGSVKTIIGKRHFCIFLCFYAWIVLVIDHPLKATPKGPLGWQVLLKSVWLCEKDLFRRIFTLTNSTRRLRPFTTACAW